MYDTDTTYWAWQRTSAGPLNIISETEAESWPIHVTYTGAELNWSVATEAAYEQAQALQRDNSTASDGALIDAVEESYRTMLTFRQERLFAAIADYAQVWDVPWSKYIHAVRTAKTDREREFQLGLLNHFLEMLERFRLNHLRIRRPLPPNAKRRHRQR